MRRTGWSAPSAGCSTTSPDACKDSRHSPTLRHRTGRRVFAFIEAGDYIDAWRRRRVIRIGFMPRIHNNVGGLTSEIRFEYGLSTVSL